MWDLLKVEMIRSGKPFDALSQYTGIQECTLNLTDPKTELRRPTGTFGF
jgi:hypothetical protein